MNWCHVQLERASSSLFFRRVHITLAWPFKATLNVDSLNAFDNEHYLHAINF